MDLENLIFRCLERFWAAQDKSRHGLVTSYDKKKHAAKVRLQPSGVETGWLPIHAGLIGDGWGVVAGLNVGDQVTVDFENGHLDVGKIVNRIHSEKDKPPEVEAGEFMAYKKDTGSIKWDKDGNITWTGANGQVVKTDKKGNTVVSLKVSDSQKSDSNSPTLTMSLEDQNGKKHSTTLSKDGLVHDSEVRIKIKSSQIEHEGSLKVSGTVRVNGVVQSGAGFKGALFSGVTGDPGEADDW